MFDRRNYEMIKFLRNSVNSEYKELKKIQQNIIDIQNIIKIKCKDDLLLVYDISNDYENDYEYCRMAYCLYCGKFIKLEYNKEINGSCAIEEYKEFGTDKIVDFDSIIDVTDIIPEEYRNCYFFSKNELLIQAQRVLDQVDFNMSKDKAKELIKVSLISYCKEKEKNRIKKVLKKQI